MMTIPIDELPFGVYNHVEVSILLVINGGLFEMAWGFT